MDATVFDAALADLGASPRTIPDAARRALDVAGYVVVAGAIDGAACEALRALCDAWAEDPDALRTGGNMRLGALSERHASLVRVAALPSLLAAARHVLQGPFSLGGVAFRSPRRGLGRQALHADWPFAPSAGEHHAFSALLCIDAFAADNGATRVVPGSHVLRPLPKRWSDPAARHPDEVRVVAAAGALIAFNGHLWHAGTENESGRPRRAVQITFHRRGARPATEAGVIDAALLSPAERLVLG